MVRTLVSGKGGVSVGEINRPNGLRFGSKKLKKDEAGRVGFAISQVEDVFLVFKVCLEHYVGFRKKGRTLLFAGEVGGCMADFMVEIELKRVIGVLVA